MDREMEWDKDLNWLDRLLTLCIFAVIIPFACVAVVFMQSLIFLGVQVDRVLNFLRGS